MKLYHISNFLLTFATQYFYNKQNVMLMKKFTLVLAVAFVAMSAAAQVPSKAFGEMKKIGSEKMMGFQKNYMNHLTVDKKKMAADKAKMQELRSFAKPSKVNAAATAYAAEDYPGLYSTFGYFYTDAVSSIAYSPMNAATIVAGNGMLDIDFYGLDPIAGKVLSVSNELSSDGADSLVIEDSQVVGVDKAGKKYYVRGVNFELTADKQGIVPVISNKPITGYYFPEKDGSEGELFINSAFGVFAEDATTPLAYSTMYYVDCLPYGWFADNICVTENKGTSYWGSENDEINNGKAFIIGSNLYLAGLPGVASAWLVTELDESGSSLTIPSEQLPLYGLKLNDGNVYDMFNENIILVESAEGTSLDWPDTDYTMFVTENDDKTLSLEGDGMSCLGFVLIPAAEGKGGSYNIYTEYSVKITNTPAAVEGVKDNAAAAAKVEYVDLAGRKVSAATKGLKIKKEYLTNGTVRSTKIAK